MATQHYGRDKNGNIRRERDVESVVKDAEQIVRDFEEQQRANERAQEQVVNDRRIHEEINLLTLQKLRQLAARPLFAEVVKIKDEGFRQATVVFKPRRVAPGPDDNAILPFGNFYESCDEADAELTLKPDPLYDRRRPEYLRRIKPEIGMRARLFYMFDNHPIGWSAPENWGAIIDRDLTADDVDGKTKPDNTGNAPQTGVVESVRANGPGVGLLTVKLDDGASVSISVILDDTPSKGTRGRVVYDTDNNPTFEVDG